MNIVLWCIQILLAVSFAEAGFLKLSKSREELFEQMSYVEDLTGAQVKLIGGVEFVGALGMILPGFTGIIPILTPLAAIGFILLMIGAASFHIRRDELIMENFTHLALAAFVAVGRLFFAPFS